MKKILFLTNLIPYPLDNGGKIKTYNVIKALSYEYKVDLLCFGNSSDDLKYKNDMNEITNNIEVIVKTLVRSDSKKEFVLEYLKSIFSDKPYNINKFLDNRFKNELINYLKENEYEFVYVDHLPMMVYSNLLTGYKIILDQHNVENLIFKRIFETERNTIKKFIGYIEYKKLKRFELHSMKSVEHIISLSEIDKQEFTKMEIQSNKISVLPIHLELKKTYTPKDYDGGKLKLLFLGSMSWYPNQNGIKWFMEKVWGEIKNDDFELYIVGSKPPAFISSYHNAKNVFVTGYVDDVDEYISKCNVSIVPLFVGSGQRVKIIESFAKGIPVISTDIGAEGLIWEDGRDILIANTPQEFIAHLKQIKNNSSLIHELSVNSQCIFNEHYSSQHLKEKVKVIINKSLLGNDAN